MYWTLAAAMQAQGAAQEPALPITAQGALVLILMALVPLAPRLWGAIVKGIETLVNKNGASTEAFDVLKIEVEHLREDRKIDRLRIAEAEKAARDAMAQNAKFGDELREVRTELATLRQERDMVRGQLEERERQNDELIGRNEKLTLTVYTLTLEGRRLRQLLQENNIKWTDEIL